MVVNNIIETRRNRKKLAATLVFLCVTNFAIESAIADSILGQANQSIGTYGFSSETDCTRNSSSVSCYKSEYGSESAAFASTSLTPTPTAKSYAYSNIGEVPVDAGSAIDYQFMIAGGQGYNPISVSLKSLFDISVEIVPEGEYDYEYDHGGLSSASMILTWNDQSFGSFGNFSRSVLLEFSNENLQDWEGYEREGNTHLLETSSYLYGNLNPLEEPIQTQLVNENYFITEGTNIAGTTVSFSRSYLDTLSLFSNVIYTLRIQSDSVVAGAISNSFVDPVITILEPNMANAYQLLLSPGVGNSLAETNPVPEPTTMLLFGTGIIGLVGSRRRRKAEK